MPLITTKSYELATYEAGDPAAARLALVLPGRLESKDYVHIRSHVDMLATLGLHAVAFDPPGSWASPGAIESYTVTNYLGAVNELIEYSGNKPTVLVGHSLGGSTAMLLAAANNPHISAYVAMMSLISGPETTQDPEWEADGKLTFYRDLPPGEHHTDEQKRYDLPYSFFEDTLAYHPKTALQECHKPKLFIIGKRDTQNASSYPPEEYALIADPKQLIEIDSHHSYRYSPATIDLVNELVKNFVLQLQPTENRSI